MYMGMQQQFVPYAMDPQQQIRLPDIQLRPPFSDFSEDAEARTSAENAISQQEKVDASGRSKSCKRVTQNEAIMSKIATTLLCNMSSFGVTVLKKGAHGRMRRLIN